MTPKPLDPLTLDAIKAAVLHARTQHPGTRAMLAALVEEVGELAKAVLEYDGDRDGIEREAIQVAAMAVRIIEEGDASHGVPPHSFTKGRPA